MLYLSILKEVGTMAVQELIEAIETIPEELHDQMQGFSAFYGHYTRSSEEEEAPRCAIVHAALVREMPVTSDWFLNPGMMVWHVAEAYDVDRDTVGHVYNSMRYDSKERILDFLRGL
jgi:hypothetical protein